MTRIPLDQKIRMTFELSDVVMLRGIVEARLKELRSIEPRTTADFVDRKDRVDRLEAIQAKLGIGISRATGE